MQERLLLFQRFLCFMVWFCLAPAICTAHDVDTPDPSTTEYLDPVHGVTVNDFVDLVLQRNPELLALKQKATEMSALLKQAGLKPNPELSASISNGSILNSPGEAEYSIAYTHTFELGGKRNRRMEVATLEAEIAAYEIADRERELIAEAKTAFMEALAAIRNWKVLQQSLELIQKTDDVTKHRVREGESPALELGLSSMELNRVRAESALASSQAQTQLFMLKALAAADPDEPLLLKEEWQGEDLSVDLKRLTEKALLNRPDLQAARLREKIAEAQIGLTKAEGASDLNAFAGYTYTTSQFDQLGLNENGTPVPLKDKDNEISVGISFNLPFRNRNQGNVHAATARKEAARLKAQGLEKQIALEVLAAVGNYAAAKQAVQILEESVVPQSAKNLEVVRASYELGELRFLDLIQEQRRALEIENANTEAWKHYRLSVIQLESKTGVRRQGRSDNAE